MVPKKKKEKKECTAHDGQMCVQGESVRALKFESFVKFERLSDEAQQ